MTDARVRRIRPSAHSPICPSTLLLVCSSALLSCANVQPPPGGPPDAVAPELVATTPESLAILPGFDDDVEFRFSEVITEGSQPSQGLGTGDLERLVILSPTNRVPKVRWRRSRITVRPDEGWQPDRVYRVELLPGIADVRGNRGKTRRVVTFTTGAAAPTDSLAGIVIDWKAGRPSPAALVEAVLLPDSLVYRAVADSSGTFRLGPVPRGEYLVYGVLDGNKNLRRDPREAFDTVRVAADSARVGDLYAFVHDTLPPRIVTVSSTDSVTAMVTFALPLDPAQRLDTTAVTLRKLPDSTVVGVRGLRVPEAQAARRPGRPPDGDSLQKAARVAPDTLERPAKDTVSRVADSLRARLPARLTADSTRRPALNDRLLLEAADPWKPGDRFLVEIRGVRTVGGTEGDVRAPLVIPEAAKRAGRPAGRDSTEILDSVPEGKDTLRVRPPDRRSAR